MKVNVVKPNTPNNFYFDNIKNDDNLELVDFAEKILEKNILSCNIDSDRKFINITLNDWGIDYPYDGVYIRDNPILQADINNILYYIRTDKTFNLMRLLSDNLEVLMMSEYIDLCKKLIILKKMLRGIYENNQENNELATILHRIADELRHTHNVDKKGLFVVFEGSDCIGKDYIIDRCKFNNRVVCTREPGGTEISEKIRDIVLDIKYKNNMSYDTEFLLYSSSRRQHVDETIIPALQAGNIVICNRYYYSSIIYQLSRGIDDSMITNITKYAINSAIPDITFSFYTNDFNILEKRLLSKTNKDRLELESIDFYKNINNEYKNLRDNPIISEIEKDFENNILPIDVSKSDSDNIIKYITKIINTIS